MEKIICRDAEPGDMDGVRLLIREYVESLGLDLGFQGLEEELSQLPGKYAAPEGALLVATSGTTLCGCVAMKKLEPGICEMKRLYVREGFKGMGIGRVLVSHILERAKAKGYRAMRLDSLETMRPAVALYRSFGFEATEPYVFNPLPGALYLEKTL
jgi:ribosomal protein S18 acetylase RimI-like enzyme